VLGRRRGPEHQPGHDVLRRREPVQQVEGLEDHAHRASTRAVPGGAGQRRHANAGHLDGSGFRLDQARDQRQQRALAAPGAAGEKRLLARLQPVRGHLESEAPSGVGEAQVADVQGGLGHGRAV
jgi:hypothetical protein